MRRTRKVKTLTTLEKLIESVNNLGSYSYGLAEYDYDTYHACAHGSDCCKNDYCRCGVIQNARVTSINADYIAKTLTDGCEADQLLAYCIDRSLRSSKAMDLDKWEVHITGGYYGEECHGVKLDGSIQSELIQRFTELDALTPADKVKKLLEYEYGFLLPRLETCANVRIINVSTDRIKLFNNDYLRKISKDTVEFYKDYKLPRAVCTKDHRDLYSVIDGYHRMLAAHKSKLPTVSIIEMS